MENKQPISLQNLKTKLNYNINTGPIPIINNKPNYNKWFQENKDDLLEIYYMITNYNKDIDFLNECNFDLFCNFCYQKSF